jgi:uncharacterized membrane protein
MRGVERLEAFSDGVYAIAITLLVIEIKVPATEVVQRVGLLHALAHHWASYAAFTLSFVIIGIMWANHHNIFRYIGRTNHTLAMLNLGLMFCTAFLPFPTAVLADYLPMPSERTTAVVLYGATLTLTAIFYNALWLYASHKRRLLKPDADQALVDAVTREYLLGPVLYALATLVAFLSVWVSLAIHALLALIYLVSNKSR